MFLQFKRSQQPIRMLSMGISTTERTLLGWGGDDFTPTNFLIVGEFLCELEAV